MTRPSEEPTAGDAPGAADEPTRDARHLLDAHDSERRLLDAGDVHVLGRMPWSSNATFLVTVGAPPTPSEATEGVGIPPAADGSVRAIYKPQKGERPLWDFPQGLYRREAAAYELSAWLGWELIPCTIVRDGPYGLGSYQRFVDGDYDQHYFELLQHRPDLHDRLREFAVFDTLANNADRKGGHVLLADDGGLWGIDNGLCFHEEPKLRTVIWDFAGEAVAKHLRPAIARLADIGDDAAGVGAIGDLLTPTEIAALRGRARRLVRRPELPEPRSERAYPWPMV